MRDVGIIFNTVLFLGNMLHAQKYLILILPFVPENINLPYVFEF